MSDILQQRRRLMFSRSGGSGPGPAKSGVYYDYTDPATEENIRRYNGSGGQFMIAGSFVPIMSVVQGSGLTSPPNTPNAGTYGGIFLPDLINEYPEWQAVGITFNSAGDTNFNIWIGSANSSSRVYLHNNYALAGGKFTISAEKSRLSILNPDSGMWLGMSSLYNPVYIQKIEFTF